MRQATLRADSKPPELGGIVVTNLGIANQIAPLPLRMSIVLRLAREKLRNISSDPTNWANLGISNQIASATVRFSTWTRDPIRNIRSE